MHTAAEYHSLLMAILTKATEISQVFEQKTKSSASREIFNFLIRHGYWAVPTGDERIQCGSWLMQGRIPDTPQTRDEIRSSVGLVFCFSDDPIPFAEGMQARLSDDDLPPGHIAFRARYSGVIVFTYCDLLSIEDLAFMFFHEARHIRHRLGPVLAQLPALDPDEIHESATWLFECDLVEAWGGAHWQAAVEKEAAWLQQHTQHLDKNKVHLGKSGLYYPELDQVFGVAAHPIARSTRGTLLGTRASILLAERKGMSKAKAASVLIEGYYDWLAKQRAAKLPNAK